jgi:hypothetical protein
MDIDEINKQAYHFVNIINKNTLIKEEPKDFIGSLAQSEEIVLPDDIVGDYWVSTSIMPNGTKYICSVKCSGYEFSFDRKDLIVFRTFLNSIYKSYFLKKCTLFFIEEIAYKWITSIKSENKSTVDFYYFINDLIDSKVKCHRYYYPVFNLQIEENFEIGDVRFSFFLKEQVEKYNSRNKENFGFYEKLLGKVYVSTQIVAEKSKAEDVSFEKCCLAFDVLKIFICDNFYPTQKLLIDIEHRASFNYTDNYFSLIDDSLDLIHYRIGANNEHFTLKKELFNEYQEQGLKYFSEFIKSEINTELKAILINAIKTFAIAITNEDLHLRISLLLSVCEMLLLKEEEKNYTSCLCQKRFVAINNKLNYDDTLKSKQILSEFYILRNKYLHNGKRLQIHLIHLSFFQTIVRILIRNVIRLSDNYPNKEVFLENYNFIEECKKEMSQKKKDNSSGS